MRKKGGGEHTSVQIAQVSVSFGFLSFTVIKHTEKRNLEEERAFDFYF